MNVEEIKDVVTYQVLQVTGTYICPPGCRYIQVEAVGGGGSGAKTNTTSKGGDGGSGGYFKKSYAAGNYAFIIGQGGPSVSVQGALGIAGTASVFGLDYAYGGAGGGLLTNGLPGSTLVANPITTIITQFIEGFNIHGTNIGGGGVGVTRNASVSKQGKNGIIIVKEIY